MIIKHTFMMKFFSELYRKLSELKEYLNWYQGEKIIERSLATKRNHVCVASSKSLKHYYMLRRQKIDRHTQPAWIFVTNFPNEL